MGQLLAQTLAELDIRFVGIEIDARLVARLHSSGMPVFFGNAARTDILSKVQAERAAAIVVTVDQAEAARHIVRAIRRQYPHVALFARARDERHAVELKEAASTFFWAVRNGRDANPAQSAGSADEAGEMHRSCGPSGSGLASLRPLRRTRRRIDEAGVSEVWRISNERLSTYCLSALR